MKHFYIYRITDRDNKKMYIGQHISNKINDNYFGSGILIKEQIKKHGKQNFIKDIIEHCQDQVSLNERESFYIKEFNTIYPYGYNLTLGGDGNSGWKMTDETKLKISQKNKGIHHSEEFKIIRSKLTSGKNNPNYGKKMSEETKNKIRNSLMGKNLSEETKKKQSEKRKGIKFSEEHKRHLKDSIRIYYNNLPREKHHSYGIAMAEEIKNKISKSLVEFHKNK
jgi:hypothetical protein